MQPSVLLKYILSFLFLFSFGTTPSSSLSPDVNLFAWVLRCWYLNLDSIVWAYVEWLGSLGLFILRCEVYILPFLPALCLLRHPPPHYLRDNCCSAYIVWRPTGWEINTSSQPNAASSFPSPVSSGNLKLQLPRNSAELAGELWYTVWHICSKEEVVGFRNCYKKFCQFYFFYIISWLFSFCILNVFLTIKCTHASLFWSFFQVPIASAFPSSSGPPCLVPVNPRWSQASRPKRVRLGPKSPSVEKTWERAQATSLVLHL